MDIKYTVAFQKAEGRERCAIQWMMLGLDNVETKLNWFLKPKYILGGSKI